jgi:hypothetical protein
LASITSNGTGGGNWSATSTWSGGKVPCVPFAVTGVATASGGSATRITITGNPTTGNGVAWANGDAVNLYGLAGTTGLNGVFVISNLMASSTTTFTVPVSYTAGYTSGGYAYHADTVTVANGDSVTLDMGAVDGNGQIIVGTDPGTSTFSGGPIVAVGTPSVSVGTLGTSVATTFTIASGVTLRSRGDIWIYGSGATPPAPIGSLVMSSGSSLIYDPGSGYQYLLYFTYGANLICNGATNTGSWPDTPGGNHCTITVDQTRGGLPSIFRAQYIADGNEPQDSMCVGMLQTASFLDISYFGTSGNQTGVMCMPGENGAYGTSPNCNFSITNCTFNYCNFWFANEGVPWSGTLYFNNNIFTNSIQSDDLVHGLTYLTFTAQITGTPTRQLMGNSFDQRILFDYYQSIVTSGNVFAGGVDCLNQVSWPNGTYFHNNLVVNPNTNYPAFIAWPSNNSNYFLNMGGAGRFAGYAATGSTFFGAIFEDTYGYENGAYAVACRGSVSMLFCLALPDPNGKASAFLVLPLSEGPVTIQHCLQWGAQSNAHEGACALGDFADASAGQCASFQANLIGTSSSGTTTTFGVTEGSYSTFTTDAITIAGNNCFYNASTGSIKYGAAPATQTGVTGYSNVRVSNTNAYPSAQIGSGDISQNPQFVQQRGFLLWANMFLPGGGSLTVAQAIAILQANPLLLNSGSTTGLFYWVRAGYVPTNSALMNGTFSGDTAVTDANGNPLNGTIGPLGFDVFMPAWAQQSNVVIGGVAT